MNPFVLPDAVRLLARAVNIMLEADGSPQRVTAHDVTVTRRDGYTIIALRETTNDVQPPINRMEEAR